MFKMKVAHHFLPVQFILRCSTVSLCTNQLFDVDDAYSNLSADQSLALMCK